MKTDDFTMIISCDQCGSTKVEILKYVGFYPGDVSFRCLNCGSREVYKIERDPDEN